MSFEVTVEQEIGSVRMERPHLVLLGAGASKAALPDGDKYGTPVPLLKEVANDLELSQAFPDRLRQTAEVNFEEAYSLLIDEEDANVEIIDRKITDYFSSLELPDTPTLYDVLMLSLRHKDAIFTFNWDPFLLQSRIRLSRLGLGPKLPRLFFLHGNVLLGFCARDKTRGIVGARCHVCGNVLTPSPLLYPLEKKNYQDGGLIEGEWKAIQDELREAFMFTVFGYSAPKTDVEAVGLLKGAWGDPMQRVMEQTEIITRPGFDEDCLRKTWEPFIHTHHYEIHDSFYCSWIGNHPRRSGEAYLSQYVDAKYISNNPVPSHFPDMETLAEWFEPLLEFEYAAKNSQFLS
jgi:hypothetical protein